MSWLAVQVRPGADRVVVLEALFRAGSTGVQEEGDALLTHFPPDTDPQWLRTEIRRASTAAEVKIGRASDVDWTEAWRAGVRRHELGRLTIVPPWLADGHDPGRTIVIEPAMAFGTGEHPTTRGAIRLLQQTVQPGDRVADLGAGSAVLSIAAAKLGAMWVAAIENDGDALGNAEENVERNGVADRVRVIGGDAALLLPLVAPVRLVLANIISSVLAGLMPKIANALSSDGEAILAGVLADERAEMVDAIEASDLVLRGEDFEESWWSARIATR